MPLLLLASILTNLLTWVFIGLDIYLWRQWYLYKDIIDEQNHSHDYAQRCLIGAIVILAYLFLGKFIMRLFLGKKRSGEDEPKAERCSEQEKIKRPDGSTIHIEHCGVKGKQTLIFIHGWNSNSMQWYYQKKHFGDRYHLILMDLPGLGQSTKPANKDFSLENLASDLNAVIEHTKPVDPVLWGHSMGGFTILTFCRLFKEKLGRTVKGIVLEHTTYTNPTKTSILSGLLTSIQNPILKPICWIMIALSPIFWLSKWMSFLNGNTLIMTRFLTFAGTESYQQLNFSSYLSTLAPPSVTGRGVLAMFEYDATHTLNDIFIPVLVVGATSDRLTKFVASQHMSATIPAATLLTLEPAGHMGLMERHQEVNEAAERFFANLA
ncbi:alpha/beta hydrolase [Mucilaginibacter sp. Bleaf8]|uniref:alpha/beta fold hydrolase n=1 Tax=Mucilaginibacter sp. Bleaf8 TaxID=2834430 RepID=UPI001BCC35B9|nr:alpha/beta hydrolase [Mucilaginibacter sp. Bleaf8]MBS7563025.1 alpha/beta hydrolase [Mucilaginibacter sp. Bleaf8]